MLPRCPSSASVAYYTPRFILNAPLASLASLARSLRGNKAIFKHLCTSFCTSWNILGAFGGVVGHLESSWTHLGPSWSRLGASQGVCVIFYPCESHLKPSSGHSGPNTSPKNPLKMELPKCAKYTLFQGIFNIFASPGTSIYRLLLASP